MSEKRESDLVKTSFQQLRINDWTECILIFFFPETENELFIGEDDEEEKISMIYFIKNSGKIHDVDYMES